MTRLIAIVALAWVAVVPLPVGADDGGWMSTDLERRLAAIAAIDVDPWQMTDEEIGDRRSPLIAYRDHVADVAADAAAARGEAEAEWEAATRELDAAREHRADMEAEVEGYSISMWVLGDLGLQEFFDSEVERIRQGTPVVAVTESLIARVEAADLAVREAGEAVDAAAVVVADRVAEDEEAQRELRDATQLRERFEAMVVARELRIDRLTDEILTEELPEVPLATITTVTVRRPVEPAEDAGSDLIDEQAAGPAASIDGGTPAEPAEIAMEEVTVTIPPIVVNVAIADQVQALIGAARSDGIDLHGSGFRPSQDQITLRVAHCGTSGYDIFERPPGECTPPTARPGESQHQLGLAVDFTEAGSILTWDSPGFAWMVANAADFGLINLPSEAWHWSTTGS